MSDPTAFSAPDPRDDDVPASSGHEPAPVPMTVTDDEAMVRAFVDAPDDGGCRGCDVRRWCPMGDLEIRACRDAQGAEVVSADCSRWSACDRERRDLSAEYNPPRSDDDVRRDGYSHRDETGAWVRRPVRSEPSSLDGKPVVWTEEQRA